MGEARRRKMLGLGPRSLPPHGIEPELRSQSEWNQFDDEDSQLVAGIEGLQARGLLKPDEDVAWHEAGHAIVSELVGFRTRYVTCVPSITKSNTGVRVAAKGVTVAEQDGVAMAGVENLVKYLQMKAAGAAVDTKRGRCGVSYEGDQRPLRQVYPGQSETVYTQMWTISLDETIPVVNQHWAAITELAEKLYRDGSVGGDVVRGIVAKHKASV
jgi:hypothetical protein